MNVTQLIEILKELDPYTQVNIRNSYGSVLPNVELTYTVKDTQHRTLVISGFYPEEEVN